MSVITFINQIEERTGKTMSLVAIATKMAIDNNNKILIVSTSNKNDKIKPCFFTEKEPKKMKFGIFGENKSAMENESGIEGIAKIARSNKLTPELITNYTKVVFKDRLEILTGSGKREEREMNDIDEKEMEDEYYDIINVAAMYYDMVFVDLDNNLRKDVKEKIVQRSDLLVVHSGQNLSNLKKLQEYKMEFPLFSSPKCLIMIGRYDKFSKYNAKNITKFLDEKNQVLTIPYNTLYFEAAEEACVPDFFLNLRKISDSEDRNKIFIDEVKRACDNILYRLKELQVRI